MRLRSGLLSLLGAVVSVMALAVLGAAPALASGGACPNEALRTGPSAVLPDCRAYEQISPAAKSGYDAVPRSYYPAQAAPDGERLAYMSLGQFAGTGTSMLPNAYVAQRGATGWDSTDITPAVSAPVPAGGSTASYVFSPGLREAVVQQPDQSLGTEATPGLYNLFLRDATGSFSWINDVAPPVVPPVGCNPEELNGCFQYEDRVAYAGSSVGFGHVLFEGTAALTPEAPEAAGVENLYDATRTASGWSLGLVGILPDGLPAAGGATAGAGSSVKYQTIEPNVDKNVAGAISDDGTHVVFQATADGGGPDPAQEGRTEVYDRINGKRTIELSAPAPEATPAVSTAQPATYWGASANGRRVFFTTKAELTSTATTPGLGQGALYEYNLETETLTDLTIDANPKDATYGSHVEGVVGVSQDGSYVYFVADGQLVENEGVDKQPNLYMVHNGGQPVYIATLSKKFVGGDKEDWTDIPSKRTAYVTPDGRHLAFTSIESLTGYDNTDQITGAADSEVYLYTAPSEAEEASGGKGAIHCASCNPSGAAPLGGAMLGGHSPTGHLENVNTAFYQVRTVSSDGSRVFFTSSDELTSQPRSSGSEKVYEYEQSGTGSCQEANGCIFLLSDPASSQEARFLDASESGNDVFFSTTSQLVRGDNDALADVYDARVEGGKPYTPSQAPCVGSCRPSPTGSLVSGPNLLSGLAGPSGNLASGSVAPKSKKRTGGAKARQQKRRLARCLAKARHARKAKRQKRLRKACHRRFGHAARRKKHTQRHKSHRARGAARRGNSRRRG